jgi:CRISPR/Cas system-associated exonuclease Cas4 (RecB family)
MNRFKHSPIILGYDDLIVVETPETGRKYVTPNGEHYSSITTILGSKINESLEKWKASVGFAEAEKICRHAGIRGTVMHNIAERYLNNESDYFLKADMPHTRALFNSIRPIIDKHINEVILQECPLYSDALRAAGRVDLVAKFDNIHSIVDFKTARRRKTKEDISSYFQQATAYAIMFEERTGIAIDQIVIIMAVDDDPDPILFVEKTKNYIKPLFETLKSYYANK